MHDETPEIPIERFEIFANNLDHPECLAFDHEGLLWAGGEAGQVYRIDRKGNPQTICTLGSFNGGIAFNRDGDLIVCNPAMGLVRVSPNGKHEVFATHAGNHKMICPNYPAFDSRGNLYVSDSGQWRKQNGFLLRFDPAGKGKVIAGPFGYANGLAITADEKFLFMVESNTDRVFRFSLHENGSVGEAEVYAENVGALPDGLALDAAGNLYASCYASDDVHRISPSGDKKLFAWDRYAILLSRPTNMAFGGEKFDEMYVANLGRTTITRAKIGVKGQRLLTQIEPPRTPRTPR
jgi:gluconolactonase